MERVVARLVRDRIQRDPCLAECLSRGIVNLSELARQLAKEIEEIEGVSVSIPAAKMALYRIVQKTRSTLHAKIKEILSKSAVIIHDSVTVITIPGPLMPKALAIASRLAEKARFLQVTQGFKTATIVISSEDKDSIVSQLDEVLEVIDGQTAIIIVSPRDIIETPGVISYLTGYLASNGINITQIISCYVDTIIVLNSSDALKAYNLIYNLIRKR